MNDNKTVMQQALSRLIWWESTYGEPTETEDLLHLSLRQAIVQPVKTSEQYDLTIAYMSGFADGKKAAQIQEKS